MAKPKIPLGIREKQNHSLYMARTGNIYRHLCERSEKQNKPVHFTLDDLRVMVRAALKASSCVYCAGKVNSANFSLDHIHPTGRGGKNRKSNLVICCDSCNTAKGILTGEEYRKLRAFLKEMGPLVQNNILGRLKLGGAQMAFIMRKR